MGKLNQIQDKINAKMKGVLADVTYPYKGSRKVDEPFDPENPKPSVYIDYNWLGIFGLSFTVRDTEVFKIQENDQKGIVFMRDGLNNIPYDPELNEVIEVRGEKFTIIDILVIPADNGWTLQLRKLG